MSNLSSFYPILGKYSDENQCSDYLSGSYEFEHQKSDDENLYFKHILKGESLISQLFEKNEIKFCITTVVKSTMYRHTFLADIKDIQQTQNSLEIVQTIKKINQNDIRHYFGCVIYAGDDREIMLNSETMGLDNFWNNIVINLKKGQILARDSWNEDKKTVGDFISVFKDENIQYGFIVEINNEKGVFSVKMNEKLFSDLQNEKIKKLPFILA